MLMHFVNDKALPTMSLAITVRDHESLDPDAWVPESIPEASPLNSQCSQSPIISQGLPSLPCRDGLKDLEATGGPDFFFCKDRNFPF